jgi:predicted alpha-1,2-mannosidase
MITLKRITLTFLIVISMAFSAQAQSKITNFTVSKTSLKTQLLTSFVDPFIGSGGHGHVFVGASVPFGAVQLGPDNIDKGWDWCSGYHYSDSILIGFAHTHLSGTGCGSLGDILIMPFTGKVKTDKGTQENPALGYASHYSHKYEKVRPGFYSVKLQDYNIDVKLTASERVGFHEYNFNNAKQAHVIIDLKEGISDKATDTYIEQTDAHTLQGYRFSKGWANDIRVYFAIVSSEPINKFDVYNEQTLLSEKKGKGLAIKGLISFDKTPQSLKLKVGISPVSAANALANIRAEIPGWDFQSVADAATEKWNKELSKVKIETKDLTNKKIFYTALYHTMIDPAIFNDHNGDYRGTDKKVYTNAPFTNYTVFSLWDTYRAIHPLYNIIQTEKVGDMINSMLAIYQQQQMLPIWHLQGCETWCMPGISSVQVVAEAYLKGIKGFDPETAFKAIKGTTNSDVLGMNYVKNLQYIPCDKIEESVAKAMEYSISDGSVSLMASKMGKTDEAAYYLKRSHNYRLYFDPVSKFFRGKRADGSWNPVFNPVKSSHPWIDDLSEGNHWQYIWLVPQDVEGLIQLQGGEKAFITRLDSLFTIKAEYDPKAPPDIAGLIGQYAHGNEPGHHTVYLYAYAGQQWKTAEKVRYILNEMYHADPDGVSGNEDCGQMSAWYIFSSLGFYPVFPANGAYVLGSPLFDKATINLQDGKHFTVEAINNSKDNIYIQHIELNGKNYDKSYILHSDIMSGGVLKIFMGNKPNTHFGELITNCPKSIYN